MIALAFTFATLASGTPPPTLLLRPEMSPGGARLLGLAGAFVGLADDSSAGGSNPAGLLALPRSFDGWAPVWGSGKPTFSPFFVALGFHPYKPVALSPDWSGSEREALTVVSRGASPGPFAASVAGPGFSTALRLERRFFIGASVRAHRATLHDLAAGGVVVSRDWAPGVTVGLFVRPDSPEAPRVGVTFRRRVAWRIGGDASGEDFDLRQPSVLSTGVSWHYDLIRNARMTFSLQQDFVRYSELNGLVPSAGGRIHDDRDFRAGVEVSMPFGCASGCGKMLQVRGGLVNRAPVPFDSLDPAVVPGNQGTRRPTSWFAGLSFAPTTPFAGKARLDLGYNWEKRSFLFGVGLRYPESYRADLLGHH